MNSARAQRGSLGRASSDVSFLERKLRGLSLRRTLSETDPDAIGPLGLNLLYQPSDAFVDFVFVHGLRGGSRKTWSATSSPAHFWPKEWLPVDPSFKHVRIHSFGYNSDWADRRDNPMSVHDFGQSLIEELQSSPTMDRESGVPIVLIGHSLGGLVIKKACIISKENPTFQDIGRRIHSMYFLATPHRGSDLAQTLNSVMRASLSGGRPFVTNLERGSEAIQVLNDQFRHYYKGIHIHSFIEAANTNFGVTSSLVVDRESATLGYAEERVQAINADHRSICKFNDPTDHNYRTLRNRLASTVDEIVKTASRGKHQTHRDEMGVIARYLNIGHTLQYELSALEDDRLNGSCEWLTNKEKFQEWQFIDESPRYFWLKGRPATGKSVMASHVINNLEGTRCSYYFFKHGDYDRSSLGGFFRSIAFQMAEMSRSIRDRLLEIAQEDSFLDKDDYRNIWRKIFVGGIFRTTFHHMHYWVIDALDECAAAERRNYDNLFNMLSKIDEHILLKIFITSRPSSDLEKLFSPLPVIHEQISLEDSQHDIRLYVEAYSEDLPVDNNATRQELVSKIVEKSSGCFLWAVLVMRQLQDVYSLEETEKVLEEVPQEMEPLYRRSLEIMSSNNRTKRLAKTILTWAVCAIRPLAVEELKDAIKLDINDTVSRDLERSIASLCGQLVYVDRHSRVQMVHQTARAFLTQPELSSEFRVHPPAGHLQLALSCLKYLNSDEMKFTAKRRSVATLVREPPKNALAGYACMSFSEHISRSSSASDSLYRELTQFLRTNVLSWIERIAEGHDLNYLVRTAKYLKAYLVRRSKHAPSLQNDVDSWATDLPRIVTEFGVNILSFPSAIHVLVAPFCPRNSIIHRLFSNTLDGLPNGIRLDGLSYPDWHDRISCIYYRDETPKAIACRDQLFAVGLSSGMIFLYKTSTCEQVSSFHHGESVRILQFGTLAKVLASAGLRSVKLWDVTTGSRLLSIVLRTDPMSLAFDQDEKILLAATRSKEVIQWRTNDATVISHYVWDDVLPNGSGHAIGRSPTDVIISIEHKLMAIVYRGMPINLWCLDTQQHLGSCARLSKKRENASHGITSAVFNPNPELWLLAVAYWDGELTLYDTLYREKRCSVRSDAQKLAVSPDGRTLAAGDTAGKTQLYDFETLQLLYHITLSGDSITALTFTSDNLRFLDLRGSQANVWEPSVLIRKELNDLYSEPSEVVTSAALEASAKPYEEMAIITTITCSQDGTSAICGRNNGVIDVHDLTSPKTLPQELYKHKGRFTEISLLEWAGNGKIVASVDNANRFQVMKLSKDSTTSWAIEEQLLDGQLETKDPINQVLIGLDGARLLVSTCKSDSLWSLETKQLIVSNSTAERRSWKWYTNPLNPSEVVLLHDSTLRAYSWNDLAEAHLIVDVDFCFGESEYFDLTDIVVEEKSELLVVKHLRDRSKAHLTSHSDIMNTQLFCLPLTNIHGGQGRIRPFSCLPKSRISNRPEIDIVIGVIKSTFGLSSLVFLSESGWVCSIDMDASAPRDLFRRHFFVPLAWLSTSSKLLARVTEKRHLIFIRGEEIAVVQNGLENVELVSLKETGL